MTNVYLLLFDLLGDKLNALRAVQNTDAVRRRHRVRAAI